MLVNFTVTGLLTLESFLVRRPYRREQFGTEVPVTSFYYLWATALRPGDTVLMVYRKHLRLAAVAALVNSGQTGAGAPSFPHPREVFGITRDFRVIGAVKWLWDSRQLDQYEKEGNE